MTEANPTREIPLTRGLAAIVDAEDYAWLSRWKWMALRGRDTWYAVRWTPRPNRKMLYMHREVMAAPPGVEVDHRFGNGLDNRRSELRLATHQQNARNRQRPQRGKVWSKFPGVTWDGHSFVARIHAEAGRPARSLGSFRTEGEAADKYRAAALEIFGEFAPRGLM